MLVNGILNPALLHLIARIRHTNTLVIADRGFPFWPTIETVDLALVDDIPTVLQVYRALRANFKIGTIFMADEFRANNPKDRVEQTLTSLQAVPTFLPHVEFKRHVPNAIGLIRTGDTIPYANMIIESA